MQQITIKTYKFEELSEEAQEKAMQEMYDINVGYGWHYDEYFEDFAQENYGLKIHFAEICFDLGRGRHFYLDTHDHGRKNVTAIVVDDDKKFLKKAGFDLRKVQHLIGNIGIDTKHYGGGDGKNIIDSYEATEEEIEKMQECLDNFSNDMLDLLTKEYEYRTSEEAIKDTIIANEYDFLENGTRSYNI